MKNPFLRHAPLAPRADGSPLVASGSWVSMVPVERPARADESLTRRLAPRKELRNPVVGRPFDIERDRTGGLNTDVDIDDLIEGVWAPGEIIDRLPKLPGVGREGVLDGWRDLDTTGGSGLDLGSWADLGSTDPRGVVDLGLHRAASWDDPGGPQPWQPSGLYDGKKFDPGWSWGEVVFTDANGNVTGMKSGWEWTGQGNPKTNAPGPTLGRQPSAKAPPPEQRQFSPRHKSDGQLLDSAKEGNFTSELSEADKAAVRKYLTPNPVNERPQGPVRLTTRERQRLGEAISRRPTSEPVRPDRSGSHGTVELIDIWDSEGRNLLAPRPRSRASTAGSVWKRTSHDPSTSPPWRGMR